MWDSKYEIIGYKGWIPHQARNDDLFGSQYVQDLQSPFEFIQRLVSLTLTYLRR